MTTLEDEILAVRRDGKISLVAQIAEIRRQIALRHRAFGRFVDTGALNPRAAAIKIVAMEAVLETLERLQWPSDELDRDAR